MKKILGILVLTLIAASFAACQGEKKKVEVVANAKIEKTTEPAVSTVPQDSLPHVVDFYATWCGPCKAMAPLFKKMEKKYAGKIVFTKVDIDNSPELAAEYEVDAVPTIIMMAYKGDVHYKKYVGLMSEKDFDAELSRLVASSSPSAVD